MNKETMNKINERLVELGMEDYAWDISEIDDEVIQGLLRTNNDKASN